VREVDLEVIAVGDDGALLLDRLVRTAEAPARRPKWVDAPKP
jgi:hypothetical protein